MSSPPDPKKRIVIKPPNGATHWAIWRVISQNAQQGEKGRRERCTSEPGEDGKVPDAWPVADFSTAKVLAQWGDGKYRVDWYDAQGDVIKGQGVLFEVATPSKARGNAGPRLRPQAAAAPAPPEPPSPVERASIAVGGGQQLGVLELLTLLRDTETRAEDRAQRNADRQMEMMMNLVGRLTERAAAPVDDPRMLQRELSQTIREQMFGIEQRLQRQRRQDDEEEEEEEIDPTDPPADLTEAGERIAMSFLADLEKRAPEAMPKVIEYLSNKFMGGGAAPNGRANGS